MKFKPFVRLTMFFAIVAVVISGCSKVIPVEQMNMQKAEEAYDRQNYDEALVLYLELLDSNPRHEYAVTAHYKCAEISKRIEKWDDAVAHYQKVYELNPSGYLGSKAKSGMAEIPKYRKIIGQNDYIYKNIRRTEDDKPIEEDYDKGAEALFQIAKAYEPLKLYNRAIEYYIKLADEFPKFNKATQAIFQSGNLCFYKLYDYNKGWPYYLRVIQDYPDSYEAKEATKLLKETKATLDMIKADKDHVHKYTSKTAIEYEKTGRHVDQLAKYRNFADQVAQDYTNIAKSWLDLQNRPAAIAVYKELARELPMEKFEAAEARYQVGRLYQQDGQYQKAIDAYNELFDKSSESGRRNVATYNQAICFQAINEFENAYEAFGTYLGFPKEDVDKDLFREAKQKIRQMEMDEDEDGYMFYQEQAANTSDQDPNAHP